jgi:hypothetical protein
MRKGEKLLLAVLCLVLSLQVAVFGEIWWPDPDYPPARKESTPDWVLKEKILFSRWDGGVRWATTSFG